MSGANDPLNRGNGRSSANQEPIRVQRVDLTDGKPGPGKRPGSGFRHHRRKAAVSRHRPALIGFLGAGLLGMVLILAIIKPGLVLGLMRPPVPSATTAAQTTPSATSSPTVAIAASLAATPSTQAVTEAPAATTLPPTPTTTAPAPTTAPTTTPTTKATTKATTARPTPTPIPSKTTATTTDKVQLIGGDDGPSGLTPLAACCGGGPPKAPLTPQKTIQVARIADGRQQATITLDSYGYSPKILVVQTGITTTFNFDMRRADSCNDQIWYAPLDRKINLAAGERVPSFKPTEDFAFSCWMGMQGVFVKAVPDLAKADLEQIEIEVTEFLESDQACH